MLKKFVTAVVSLRKWVIVFSLIVTGFFIIQIHNLHVIIDPNTMLPQQHPYVIGTNLAEKIFGSNYVLVIGIEPKQGDIYQPEVLHAVQQLTEKIALIPEIKKETILSLTASRVKNIQGDDQGMNVTPFFTEVPTNPDKLHTLSAAIRENPIYLNTIVANDGKMAVVTAAVVKGPAGFRPMLDEVYQLTNATTTPNLLISVSGAPMYLAHIEQYAQRMAYLFPLALLIVGLLHFEAFRSWQGFILPLVTALLSVVWGLGFMGLAHIPMDAFNSTTPILILAVTAGHAVQILKRYYEEYEGLVQEGYTPTLANHQAIIQSISIVGPVMLAAGIVAVASFFSLINFDVETIRNFGVFTGLGILSGLWIELTFIPAVRALLQPPKLKSRANSKKTFWDQIISFLSYLVLKHRRGVYITGIGILVVMVVGVQKINFDNSNKSFFAEHESFQKDDQHINQHIGGTNSLYMVFDGATDDAIKSPQLLKLIADTQAFIANQPGVGKTISIADLLKKMHAAMHRNAPVNELPNSRDLIAQYLLLYSLSGDPGDFDRYVDYNYRYASITAYLKYDNTAYVHHLIEKINHYLDQEKRTLSIPQPVKIYYGGSVPQSAALSEVLVAGKIRNILQIALVVLIVTILVFRSFWAGILVLIPLTVTALFNFSLMGWAHIPLNTPNAISAAMAVGIGADYAIYLLYRIREYMKSTDLENAIQSALATAGKAALYVATAIAGGYSALFFSFGFNVHVWFGILIVASMMMSALSALILIPVFVIDIRPQFLRSEGYSVSFVKSPANSASFIVGILILSGTLFSVSQHSDAAELDPVDIMQKNYLTTRLDSSISHATYKLVNKNGDTRTRETFGVTQAREDKIHNRRMTRFLSPADIRNTSTLIVEEPNGNDEIWVYLPAMKKVRRLSASNKKDSFIGTDLSYGDVMGYRVEEWHHTLARDEMFDGVMCHVIESIPKNETIKLQSGYSKRVSWIQTQNYVALKTDFYDVSGQRLKTVLMSKIHLMDQKKQRWQPYHVEVQNYQTGHSTLIDFDKFVANQDVDPKYFTTRYLEKEE